MGSLPKRPFRHLLQTKSNINNHIFFCSCQTVEPPHKYKKPIIQQKPKKNPTKSSNHRAISKTPRHARGPPLASRPASAPPSVAGSPAPRPPAAPGGPSAAPRCAAASRRRGASKCDDSSPSSRATSVRLHVLFGCLPGRLSGPHFFKFPGNFVGRIMK